MNDSMDNKPSLYRPPRHPAPIEVDLSSGERCTQCLPCSELTPELDPDALRRYPKAAALEQRFANFVGTTPGRVYVTAGADEAIDRICRAFLRPGDKVLCAWPGFEMIPRYVALAGAELQRIDWPSGPFPRAQFLESIDARTKLVIIVTPNNPTGGTASAADIETLSAALPEGKVLVDLAYTEFADEDLTQTALALANTIVTRTLSKAWGLAGLRVGFALSAPGILDTMRAAGGPYSVAGVSLALADLALRRGEASTRAHVEAVKGERKQLRALANALGWESQESQGNFVLWRGPDPRWLRDGLAGLGIGVRLFVDRPELSDAIRITCPGDEALFIRLEAGLRTTLAPQAVLLDMDGVLADVSASYRSAIRGTAQSFGITLEDGEVEAEKLRGDANDDWALTHRLVQKRGVEASLEEVTRRFEALYQGTDDQPGYRARERLIPERAFLRRLAKRFRLGIVTGRPRSDALRFLKEQEIEAFFEVVVCREDAPLKPDPAPIQLAMRRLSEIGASCERAWYVGDTPDDTRSARQAGLVPLSVIAPASDPAVVGPKLLECGSATILSSLAAIEELLP